MGIHRIENIHSLTWNNPDKSQSLSEIVQDNVPEECSYMVRKKSNQWLLRYRSYNDAPVLYVHSKLIGYQYFRLLSILHHKYM